MERFADLASDRGRSADGRALLDDNLSMVVSDVLQAYSPFAESEREQPDQWYVVGVLMYALGQTSRKPLPVELVALGTLVKRVRGLGADATRERILQIEDLYSPGLFAKGDDDRERIADVLYDYASVAFGGQDEHR